MRRLLVLSLLALPLALPAQRVAPNSTFANPLNLEYRFMGDSLSWRQAADPVIVPHAGRYFLFASRSGGYWHSTDLREWTHVVPEGLPIEDYAPALLVLDGRLYYTAHKSRALFTTDDPVQGRWRKVAEMAEYPDPAFFRDDDGRVYLYFGSSLGGGISAVELDPKRDFAVARGPVQLMRANHAEHGWERSGAAHLGAAMSEGYRIAPYVEGSWMSKHDGTYYLQYAAPGTVWTTYGDGVYTSRDPMSGFAYQPYSPFSYKPGGFVGGAGHSGTFRDHDGRWWRVTTMVIAVKHKFERRLGIFPAGFDADGVMRMNGWLGDYPQFLPGVVRAPLDSNLVGWMLLSRGKPVTVSSTRPGHPAALAVDEDIRTHWSAATGERGEWLQVDLGRVSRVAAVQVNFAEEGTRARLRQGATPHRYRLEASLDGRSWTMLLDRSGNERERPHDYVQLDAPREARWLRVTNAGPAAGGGTFSLRDLRVFGRSDATAPSRVEGLEVRRATDPRGVTLRWRRAAGAHGYVVRYGLSPDKLYAAHELGDATTLTINALNAGVTYYFTVDAVGEGGVTRGTAVRRG
ncbi:MAG TPA: family 43 glycosylhydrolase [Gemmatimonadaceae bacterium]|nr:family 43 glycosylhydrolase [Gemmatimonadaceae bacterium]